jgi:hypothetical protein
MIMSFDGAIDPPAAFGQSVPAELAAEAMGGADCRLVDRQHRAVPRDSR